MGQLRYDSPTSASRNDKKRRLREKEGCWSGGRKIC